MKLSRYTMINLSSILFAFVVAALMYDSLPQVVPTHWNARGIADGFTPKPWGPFILPLTMVGVYLLFLVLPAISPRGFRIGRFLHVYWILCSSILVFLLIATVLALIQASGTPVPLDRVIDASVGLLTIVLGNFMGKITKNFFIGIKTPWTLASDEVWFRTHRLAGKLLVFAGLLVLICGVLGFGGSWQVWVIVGAALIPAVYSLVIYKRIEGFKDDSVEVPSKETYGANHSGNTSGVEKRP